MEQADPAVLAALEAFMLEGIPFNRVLGVDAIALEAGFARLEIPYRDDLVGNPAIPALHGGVLSALIDVAGGAATLTLTRFPDDATSTIDLRIDYLRPAGADRVVAEARVTRMGNRVTSVDGKVFHPGAEDRLLATAKGVYNVARGVSMRA